MAASRSTGPRTSEPPSRREATARLAPDERTAWPWIWALGLGAAFAWSFWPTLTSLVAAWEREEDYSHGYLVVPIALAMLWARRRERPAVVPGPHWGGLWPLAAAFGLRLAGSVYFIDALDGWSLPLWLAGAVWIYAGPRFLVWTLPSIGFLYFMAPLPYQAETLLSVPLQRVATQISTFLLQSLGLPAIAEGHTILLNEHKLEVAEACSGLRMLVSVFALAYAYMVLVPRSWWVKLALAASVIPIALLSNALRITATGLLYEYVSSDAGKRFSHDAAGWVMIVVAAAFMGLFLWYLGKLVIEVRQARARDLLSAG